MTSRLERLFLLLETGQSSFLRRSAAFQIGEVVKTHPKELGQLLEKLKPLVTNSSWETRIAASQTIESIMKYLNEHDLITNFFQMTSSNSDFRLENFNLISLLANGSTLLSSDTQKYDIKPLDTSQVANNQLTEKIKQQRNLLNLKLGIDVGGAAKLDTSHIFSDYDIIASEAEVMTSNIDIEIGLKRKGSDVDIKIEPGTSNGNTTIKKLKLEDETEEQLQNLDDEEKINHIQCLLLFTKWLFNKLFNPEWEIRHGSATCLREIIKKLINTILVNNNINLVPNFNFFEICLYKLFSVVALDRFADYIGDEVVAPVRETCTQTIGIISKLFTLNTADTNRLCSVINMFLTKEISKSSWEIRHAGIMILKYTIAAASASNETINLKQIFSLTFENILKCIKDNDDDVRQMASSSLEPVSKQLNELLTHEQLESLVKILIDVLSDLDDLGTSCSNIMSLLSDLLELNENQATFIKLLNGQSILPRLLPFLNHSSLNVKQTTLNTINKIILAINSNAGSNNSEEVVYKFEAIEKNENLCLLFRILYQQSILMNSENGFKILEKLLVDLWHTLCYNLSPKLLVTICFPYITTWLVLFMYPSNQQIETAYLVNNTETTKEYLGSNQIRFEEKLIRDMIQIKCRLLVSKLLSILFHRVSFIEDVDPNTGQVNRPFDLILNFLSTQINFKSGLQRFCFSLLIIDLASLFKKKENKNTFELIQKNLSSKIIACLDDENTIYFDEIAVLFTRLQKEIRFLLTNYQKFLAVNLGINLNEYLNRNVFTFDDITALTNLVQDRLNSTNLPSQKQDAKLIADLKLLISNLTELNKQAYQEQEQLQIRSLFSLASACIQLNTLCERMNPLIRPLIECIRFESNSDLQIISSKHLAFLLQICSKRQPNPVPKIFKNLLNYLCNDHTKTPQIQNQSNIRSLPDKDFYDINRYYGIISDNTNAMINSNGSNSTDNTTELLPPLTPNTPITPNKLKKRANSTNGPSSADIPISNVNNGNNNETNLKNQIEKRGAEFSFKSIIECYNSLDQLELVVPDLVTQPLSQIDSILSLIGSNTNNDELGQINDLNLDSNINKYQELLSYLSLIEYICSLNNLDRNLMNKFMDKVPDLMKLIKLPLSSVRNLTARCLATICKQELVRTMQTILEYILDSLDNNEFNLFSRQGAIELIFCLFEQLNNSIIPFIVIFIVPILKRMCDLDWYVRSMASQCFATLVKLYPLSSSNSVVYDSLTEITQTNPNIRKMKIEQQDFLDQLMDNRKLKSYELPHDILINVKLRPYQQMGVNWLAFLKKFNLHGILCDDMGLGKTLQSICILSGDHYEKQIQSIKNEHIQPDDDDLKFTPSIIICPTTLTNHWHHEIERFVDRRCLRPFIYCGSIAERENLRKTFFNKNKNPNTRYNVFIVSYDIIRHDIQYLCNQKWNYCILDEGHLIKSSKTKLSKSIKQIRASHRLILTGTPIQNNVTELWCLFDFLLPGYLGTEKQFHLKYARYIAPQSASFQNKLERALSHQQQSNDNNGKTKSNGPDSGFHQLSIIALESLHKQVLPFLLRRTKEEVLKDLPPKIIQDYYCEMSQIQIELYQDFAKSNVSDNIKKSLGLLEGEEENGKEDDKELKSNSEHVFQALQYLRKVVNHPSLVLKPDHPKWSQIKSELISSQTSINDIKHSGKLLALRDLLMECGIGNNEETNGNDLDQNSVLNQHRVLIFCQLKSMIDIIENELLKKMLNVSFLRLDGTIPPNERFNVVKKFNSDPSIDILLLTTQIGGLGLNLTGADTVIFVEHDWNPQKDLQAMDRAHRIGQTKVVNVYRLITKRTIEEKIMSLQKFKLGIANSVVNIENSNLSSMGTEQLMNMFNREMPTTSGSNEQKSSVNTGNSTGYQRLLDNINEIWDDSQYENEYNLDNFIKSLN